MYVCRQYWQPCGHITSSVFVPFYKSSVMSVFILECGVLALDKAEVVCSTVSFLFNPHTWAPILSSGLHHNGREIDREYSQSGQTVWHMVLYDTKPYARRKENSIVFLLCIDVLYLISFYDTCSRNGFIIISYVPLLSPPHSEVNCPLNADQTSWS